MATSPKAPSNAGSGSQSEGSPMSLSEDISAQYSTGDLRDRIRRALELAGKDPDHLEAYDLALMEDFHSSGRLATANLIEVAAISPDDRVLDAGTGIGGTARVLAHEVGCRVTALDLTSEYCEIAEWLNSAVALDSLIDVHQGDVLELPFEDTSFDVVVSQHVQMNIHAKDRLYSEARRVLRPGGRLALWDATDGPNQPLLFPVPWAESPKLSHLATPEELRRTIEAEGFETLLWNDLTASSADFMKLIAQSPPAPLGLH
ncbi:MAG: class I SAM-dependent methyltransferase, partial [Candidatus Dormibacteria bacterium]